MRIFAEMLKILYNLTIKTVLVLKNIVRVQKFAKMKLNYKVEHECMLNKPQSMLMKNANLIGFCSVLANSTTQYFYFEQIYPKVLLKAKLPEKQRFSKRKYPRAFFVS